MAMDDYLDQFAEDHVNDGYGDILDELKCLQGEEYPDIEEPWDEMLAQRKLKDFERCDEYYWYFGGDEDL
jgi:hypothetical protein